LKLQEINRACFYVRGSVDECGLLGAKPIEFPMEPNHKLGLATGELLSDPTQYRRLVGRLIYLTLTRPELSYSVHILSQVMQAPREVHMEAAKCMLRYLKGNPGQGILLRSNVILKLLPSVIQIGGPVILPEGLLLAIL